MTTVKPRIDIYSVSFSACIRVLVLNALMLASAVSSAQNYSASDTTTEYNATATYYADKFVGRKTSSGEVFSQDKYTAAHHSIKFGTLVLVTNKKNGQQVIVKVNDRCPRRGVIDLTRKAIRAIGIKGSGKVTIRLLPKSYQSAWEQQSEPPQSGSRTAFGQGDSTQPPGTPTEATDEKPLDDKRPTAGAIPVENNKTPPQTEKKNRDTASSRPAPVVKQSSNSADSRYDLQLATGVSRSQVERLVGKLPMNYRESAQFVPDRNSGKLTMLLPLSATQKKALSVQKKLSRSFPGCQLIQCR